MIYIKGKKLFYPKLNSKKYKVIICDNKDKITDMINYFKFFIKIDTKDYPIIGIDFEFNRSLDKKSREIALFQINLETLNNKGQIYLFYPPDLNKEQINVLKKLLTSNKIKTIIHGGESLDIPYIFNNLLTTDKEQQDFCVNLYDTKFLCEYYNIVTKKI